MKNNLIIFVAGISLHVACGSEHQTSAPSAGEALPAYKTVINYEELKTETYNPNGKSIFMFGASWCGPCKVLKPKLETLAKESEGFDDFIVVYVDHDAHTKIVQAQGVTTLPTVKVYNEGKVVGKQTGGTADVGIIRQFLNKIRPARFRK
jgi:thioredoxin 1